MFVVVVVVVVVVYAMKPREVTMEQQLVRCGVVWCGVVFRSVARRIARVGVLARWHWVSFILIYDREGYIF